MGLRPINVSHVVSPEDWQQAEGVAEPTGAYVLGLDLSDGHAMCGASAFWLETGKLEGHGSVSFCSKFTSRAWVSRRRRRSYIFVVMIGMN